jgi:ppGpp synthetase/RelA/SpoT-type nucleotidyltranferase
MQMPHRIKTWESVKGKLERKPDKYPSVNELSDILGYRVICYFSSDVDKAAEVIRRVFEVDESRSTDKRELISPTTFGYLSLHYICTLPEDGGYPEDLTKLRFEFQIRSVLQHAWAEIDHDLGYKTVFEVPRDVRRNFSRIASILEVADELFDSIRSFLGDYEKEVYERIHTDNADEMALDRITLNEFISYSPAMKNFLDSIADRTGGKIQLKDPEEYLPLLSELSVETLGDLEKTIMAEGEHALMLLDRTLQYSDLEEVTSNAALYYLCQAKVIWGEYSEKDIYEMCLRLSYTPEIAKRICNRILHLRKQLNNA